MLPFFGRKRSGLKDVAFGYVSSLRRMALGTDINKCLEHRFEIVVPLVHQDNCPLGYTILSKDAVLLNIVWYLLIYCKSWDDVKR